MNTTTITFVEAPPVVFMGRVEPQADLVGPVTNSRWHKPGGGIWTCPAAAEYGWRQWCDDEMPEWTEDTDVYNLVPAAGTRVVVIDSPEDLRALIAAFPAEGIYPGAPETIDFEALARVCDGLWLTERGQWATRFTDPGLYGYDLECILFFRWVF